MISDALVFISTEFIDNNTVVVIYYAPAPIVLGHEALMAVICLSVRPPVPFLAINRERRYPIPRGTQSAGAQNTQGWEILQFSSEIAVYLRSGAR